MEPPYAPPPEPGPIEPRPAEPGFPLTRDDFNLSDLLSRASEAWSRDLGPWVLAMVLYAVIGFGVPAVLGFVSAFFGAFEGAEGSTGSSLAGLRIVLEVVVQIIQLVLSAIFTLGFWAMALHALQRDSTRVGILFSQLSKIWKYIVQMIVLGLGMILLLAPVVVIVFLAFVGPVDRSTPMSEIMQSAGTPLLITFGVLAPVYIYIAAGLVFTHAELAYNDDAGPIDAIVYSWRMSRGKRWMIIGVGLIGGLITAGSAMLCGIGLLFGVPFVTLLMGALYLALRQGADVPRANTATTLGPRY
jgi:hypothetical protein